MNRITIAIDGYSSCGKSTLAKQLAKELGYTFVDSGAMYRAVALYAMQNGCFNHHELNENCLVNKLDEIAIQFTFNASRGASDILLNGKNVENEIPKNNWYSRYYRLSVISSQQVC